MFKCLIFVQGLTALNDPAIRSRLLSKLEQDSKLTLQNIAEECQRIIDLCHGIAKIEEKEHGKKGLLLKLILVMDTNKYTYVKIAPLKIKNFIIVEIRIISSCIVKRTQKKQNLKYR